MSSLRRGTGCESSPSAVAFRFLRGALTPFLLLVCLTFCVSCRSELEVASWQDVSATPSRDGASFVSISRKAEGSSSSAPALLLRRLGQPAGQAKLLYEDVSPVMPPAFSADGKSVLFMRRGLFHMVLMSQPVDGGEAVELASLRVSPQHLRCLRSNSSIVLITFMEGWFGVSSSIKVYDLDKASMREIEDLPTSAVTSAAVSADGRVLVFSDGRGLWRIGLSDAAPVAESIPTTKTGPLDRPLQFALSGDGSQFCLRLGRLEHRNVGEGGADFASPELSKVHYKTVDMRRLALVDLAGDKPLRILGKESSFRLPVFSPDSKSLAFVEGSRLCVCDLASGAMVSVPCPGFEYGEYLEWFDAKTLICRVMGGPHIDARLMLVPANGEGSPKEL